MIPLTEPGNFSTNQCATVEPVAKPQTYILLGSTGRVLIALYMVSSTTGSIWLGGKFDLLLPEATKIQPLSSQAFCMALTTSVLLPSAPKPRIQGCFCFLSLLL